ncbi:hypothetical protein BDP67DRAFT_444256 [Colletotrichum lupini]|nr:hypothetical protein BDP67DRAFT_444256 [Colletotrichum lupini]
MVPAGPGHRPPPDQRGARREGQSNLHRPPALQGRDAPRVLPRLDPPLQETLRPAHTPPAPPRRRRHQPGRRHRLPRRLRAPPHGPLRRDLPRRHPRSHPPRPRRRSEPPSLRPRPRRGPPPPERRRTRDDESHPRRPAAATTPAGKRHAHVRRRGPGHCPAERAAPAAAGGGRGRGDGGRGERGARAAGARAGDRRGGTCDARRAEGRVCVEPVHAVYAGAEPDAHQERRPGLGQREAAAVPVLCEPAYAQDD